MLFVIILGALTGGFLYIFLPLTVMVSLDLGLRGARIGVLCSASVIGFSLAAAINLVSDAPAFVSLVTRPAPPEAVFDPMPNVVLHFWAWLPEIALAVAFWWYVATRPAMPAPSVWIAGAAMAISSEALVWGQLIRDLTRSSVWSRPQSAENIELMIFLLLSGLVALLVLTLPGWAVGRLIRARATTHSGSPAPPMLRLAWIWPAWIVAMLAVHYSAVGPIL